MSARLLVLPKFLRCSQARKAIFFIFARACKKIAVLGMLANARKDHSSPLLKPLLANFSCLKSKTS